MKIFLFFDACLATWCALIEWIAPGLPAGVLNVVTGKGSVIGEALNVHPDVDKLSFTGSTSVGRHVAEVAVEPVENIRDLTGAGDAFNAGFLTATLRGAGLEEAVVAAHSLARRVLAHPGASEGEVDFPSPSA